jgi:HPt (histidine-containing phosphotransfer) domain-containing protein
LKRWRSGDYALLLTDLHMPKMDGYELSTAIRALESGARHIVIIALTANALKGEALHCREVGMDDYLIKPASLADLQTMLRKWLPGADTASPPADPTTPTAETHLPNPVDVSVLVAMIGDDPDVLIDFLQDFRRSTRQVAAEMRTAYGAGQGTQVGALAHKLKSSARAVGALRLGEVCDKIEQSGKADQDESLAALLPLFDAEIASVDRYLETL